LITMTRRERQKQANREGILTAALEIGTHEGWQEVTIRRLAERIEYTSPIIYQHFDNKEAVLNELVKRGFKELETHLRKAETIADPDERLLALSHLYLGFARDHSSLYALINGIGGVTIDGKVRHEAASGVIAVATALVQGWAHQRGVKLADPLAACETAWGVLHGMATLGMLQNIGFERAEQLALKAALALMKSWEVPS
jgi:AcrR family transcriptional regulator